jgi:hypothetical protein
MRRFASPAKLRVECGVGMFPGYGAHSENTRAIAEAGLEA